MYLLAGPFLCDRAVHKELGGPVYSAPGVQWWFATEGDRDVIGFATLRDAGSEYWLDYGYVVPHRRNEAIFSELAAHRQQYLSTLPPKPVRVVCREARWPHYQERGFQVKTKRGSWIYGILNPITPNSQTQS